MNFAAAYTTIRIKPMTDAQETRTKNSRENHLAASRYDTRTSFSRELTLTSFSYQILVRVSWALVVRKNWC